CTTPPPTDTAGKGTASSVTVTQHPADASAGTNALVCWRVDGSGNVKHTALHYDAATHAGASAKFTDYAGGTVYPGNATSAASAGYNLPGDFCANIPVGDKGVYFRAHVIDASGGDGKLSEEQEVEVRSSVSVLVPSLSPSNPASGTAGKNVTLCWSLTGSGHAAHTAIHWDTTSHPGQTTFSAYQGGTVYPNNTATAASSGYNAPGSFCGNLTLPASGASGYVYYRAHVMSPPDPPGTLTNEARVSISSGNNTTAGVVVSLDFTGSQFTAGSYALQSPAGQNVTLCWAVTGTGTIPHTAVHWGPTSHATDPTAAFTAYSAGAIYPGNGTAQNTSGYALSGTSTTFCGNVLAPTPAGTLWYYRAHAIDTTGGTGRLSTHEVSITAQ
ncbi:MAG: hypothetical protein LC624_03920, partial [Halobacteriales archaeon]|nr:hypothetical protein [Halobacteriales archaeon]